MELIILCFLAIFAYMYRINEGQNAGQATYKYFTETISEAYNKYAPYSFKSVREKVKELGQEYGPKEYLVQIIGFAGLAAIISYLYFYNIFITIMYAVIAVLFIPYISYLRYQRIYTEYIFEQIQVYTTNVIMEFNTTQSFVKSLEGVRDSGILEEPVLSDVKTMIDMSYTNGTIDQSIIYFNEKYPYYMVKNMHQLFLQITKEGARDSGEALEGMSMDIDALVEGVYRDRMDRANFHKRFLSFGLILYFLVMAMQFLLGRESYLTLLDLWYVHFILHAIIIINSYFLLTGEKYYNEQTGVE